MNATSVLDRPAGIVSATHPWNSEAAADALRDVFGRSKTENLRALVPSAAMADEIVALSQLHFETLVVDPDARALKRIRRAAQGPRGPVSTLQSDFLNLNVTLPGRVDVIVDRLYFHALPPVRRADWAHKVARLIHGNGHLAGLFLIGHRLDGPPYPISREELRRTLARSFEIKSLEFLDGREPDGDHAAKGLFRRL